MAEGRAPTGHSDGAWQEKGNGGTNKFQGSYLLEDEFRPSWLEDKGLNSTTGRYTSYCKWCGVGFKTNKTTIDDHEGTARHKKQLDEHKKKVVGRQRMGNAPPPLPPPPRLRRGLGRWPKSGKVGLTELP